MAISRTYRCPACAGEFRYLHHPNDEPPPRFCPHCAYDTHAEDVVDFAAAVSAPHIRNRVIVQAVEDTYRGMEAGAQNQIRLAAEATGEPESEFANMKITNLRDNLREGDIASVPVNNAVSQAMSAAPNVTGFQNPDALNYAAAAHTGPDAHAGARAAGMIRRRHAASGAPMHEAPTVETLRRGSGTSF